MRKTFCKLLWLVVLLSVVWTTGCDNTEFRNQIGQFQAAMNESRGALQSYYAEMNQFEKDLYLLRREVDGGKPLGIEYMADSSPDKKFVFNDNVLYVEGPFPPEAIQARLDALSLISLYGNRLAELAGTDSPTQFADNTAALGDNIVNLAGTFTKLSGSGADKTAANYVGPISKLIGMVGKLFLERKRDKELVAAIKEATPEITKVTTQLRIDFDEVLVNLRETGMRGTISVLVLDYNKTRDQSDRRARKVRLAEIDAVVRMYELFKEANPATTITTMENANQALLAYATTQGKDLTFTQLVARIGEFRDFAQKTAAAIAEIRAIRKELKNANGQ